MKMIKKSSLLLKVMVNANRNNLSRIRTYYAKDYNKFSVQDNLILYESRDGQSITDSPLAIFLFLINDIRFEEYKHVWVVDNKDESIKESIPEEYRKRVTFVIRNTKEYVRYLLSAKYLINNSTFQSFFSKKKDQIYINTWHGTPLKHMGYDIPGSLKQSQNVVRNLLMSDYFISPNSYTTKIFTSSYRLKGIYTGRIIESGYPRIDLALLDENYSTTIKRLKTHGIIFSDDKPIALYTPTWKGTSIQKPIENIEQIVNETLILKEKIKDKYQLFVKVHPYVFSYLKDNLEIKEILIPDSMDANQLLGITDLLITDYSSIFFDFLVTEKPIVFYSWDKDIYETERGMYLEEERLPGPVAENIEDLYKIIENVPFFQKKYREKYAQAQRDFANLDDGKATQRIVDYVFLKKEIKDSNMKALNIDSPKQKLLFYPGNLANNGITSSFLNLMDNLDYEKYDVTVFTEPGGRIGQKNLLKLNKKVHLLFKPGAGIYTIREDYQNRKIQEFGLNKEERAQYPTRAFQREANRLLAGLKFDVAIDFSGYSYFWAKLILGSNAKKYIVFQHNDLFADSQKVVNGKRPHEKSLPALFSIYYRFDRILSVSPMTMEINKDKLKNYIDTKQLGSVVNSINTSNFEKVEETEDVTTSIDSNSDVKRVNKLFTVTDTKPYNFFKNRKAIFENKKSMAKLVEKGSIIQAVATVTMNNNVFYKCLVNHIYFGWMQEVDLITIENQIYSVKDSHIIATIKGTKGKFIWKDLSQIYVKDMVSPLSYLKNSYAFCDRFAQTLKGNFYRIYDKKGVIGWVDEDQITRKHNFSKLNPLRLYFVQRNSKKKLNIPDSYEIKNNVIQIEPGFFKNEKYLISPLETTSASEKKLNLKKDTNYLLSAKLSVGTEEYGKLNNLNGGFLAWIDGRYIKEMDIDIENTESDETSLKRTTGNIPVNNNYFNFVTMGRLSPEKNFAKLIEAFALFLKEVPRSTLFILGEGALRKELEELITRLNLQEHVFLLGHLENPFQFMKKNDVFVLPSNYEGQPMVLLEAMSLGMKILASNIPANINVVGETEQYGMLTNGTDVESLYKGLARIYHFDGKFGKFDYIDYNKEAMNEFYHEIEVD